MSSNSHQTWQYQRLKLDWTPPLLIVTNPITSTVSVPMIQLQGCSPEALSRISYDITNAAGLATNQQVLISDQYYSTNTFEFTTNTFQGYDIRLANGLNTITLHATDLAGNTTATHFSITLDYSTATNPPVVQLYWPQNGTLICNGTYTWRGWVDDPTATVTAQTVDTNGNTNIFNGIVERNGNFWVENLPLSNGTNYLTLTVTNAAGNVAATNITVSPGAVALTIDAPSSDQLWNPSITVTGTISDSSDYTVWVNGSMAALSGASWMATNVFLPPGGTAVIQARAIPNTNNGGNGTGGSGGGPASYNSLGNPGSSQAQDVEDQTDRPSRFYIDSYMITDNGTSTGTDNYGSGEWDSSVANGVTTGKWVDGAGGSASWNLEGIGSDNSGIETNYAWVNIVYEPTLLC